MKTLLQIAGVLQLTVAAANLPAKRALALGSELARLSPIVRQIYTVQHAYIVWILLFFGGLALFDAPVFTGGGPWAAFLALFWGARLAIQRLYYDPEIKRRHRGADVFFTALFAYLTAVFALAATGGIR